MPTEEELAAQAAADEAEAEAQAEADRIAAEDAAQGNPPAPLSEEKLAEMIASGVATARAEWDAEAERQAQVQAKALGDEDRYAQFFDQYGTCVDPKGYSAAIRADTKAEIIAELSPRIRSTEAKGLVEELSAGLGTKGQEYIAKYAPQLDPENTNQETKNILRDAASFQDKKFATTREAVERTGGEQAAAVAGEDKRIAGILAGITSSATGIDAKSLMPSDEALRASLNAGDEL